MVEQHAADQFGLSHVPLSREQAKIALEALGASHMHQIGEDRPLSLWFHFSPQFRRTRTLNGHVCIPIAHDSFRVKHSKAMHPLTIYPLVEISDPQKALSLWGLAGARPISLISWARER